MAITPQPLAHSPGRASALPATSLRRCTFRRVVVVAGARELPQYEVACIFPDRRVAIPLGDVESARPICESCTDQGIFRPDSD